MELNYLILSNLHLHYLFPQVSDPVLPVFLDLPELRLLLRAHLERGEALVVGRGSVRRRGNHTLRTNIDDVTNDQTLRL